MELKILSLNLWLLPPPFSVENKNRLKKFVEFIKSQNPDIVALQEVWLKRYVNFLRKHLKDYNIHCCGNSLYNKSGLVTLSKIKPQEVESSKFKNTGKISIIEQLAKKGYLKTKLSIAGKMLSIINTHLYDSAKEKGKLIKEKQFEQLKKIIKEDISIVAGDLNLRINEFLGFNKGYFCVDDDDQYTVSSKNPYSNMRFNKNKECNKKIDYVLLKNNSCDEILLRTKVIRYPLLSDHFAILSILSIKN
jgi:endonuclease/exonuclease/phosphatase family metal-dependent hydrolase